MWHCCTTTVRRSDRGCAYTVQPLFCIHSCDLLHCTAWTWRGTVHCGTSYFYSTNRNVLSVSHGHVSGKPSYPSNVSLMQQRWQQQQHNGLHSANLQWKAGHSKLNEAKSISGIEGFLDKSEHKVCVPTHIRHEPCCLRRTTKGKVSLASKQNNCICLSVVCDWPSLANQVLFFFLFFDFFTFFAHPSQCPTTTDP